MNNLAAMLYVEITIMCFLIMGIIVCRLFKSLERRWEHQVLIMTLSLFQLAILCDGAWTALTASAVSLPRWLLWAVNHGYFIAISLGCLGWFLYAEKQQNAPVSRKPWRIALVAIPILAMVAMILLSPFTHWIFFIDEQNVYHRGPLHGLHIIVSYGYMLFASIRAMILALQKKNYARRTELLSLTLFTFVPLPFLAQQLLSGGAIPARTSAPRWPP